MIKFLYNCEDLFLFYYVNNGHFLRLPWLELTNNCCCFLDELSISSDDFDEYSTNTVANGDHVEDKAAADAAKELFGNNLIQEIQQNEVLDWDDIISSNGLPIDPTLTTTTTQVHNTCEPLTTTVELDNAAHYYGNTNGHQEYDIQMPYISHYYSVPPPQHLHVGFWWVYLGNFDFHMGLIFQFAKCAGSGTAIYTLQ